MPSISPYRKYHCEYKLTFLTNLNIEINEGVLDPAFSNIFRKIQHCCGCWIQQYLRSTSYMIEDPKTKESKLKGFGNCIFVLCLHTYTHTFMYMCENKFKASV